MFPYIYKVPFNVPVWYPKTFLEFSRCLITGKVIHGRKKEKLHSFLSKMYPNKEIYLVSNGRYALELALKGLGVQSGEEVILPSFCCSAVITAILGVGGRPVFSDSGPDLNVTQDTIEKCLTNNTKVVVVPHMFGNPADILGIRHLCVERGIKVVDDAAQALGSRIGEGRVGGFGDAGIGSFGKGKICFGTGGGWLVIPQDQQENFTNYTGAWIYEKHAQKVYAALGTLIWRRWRRWTLPFGMIMAKWKSERIAEKSRASMSNLDAAIALTLLEKIEENIRLRHERAQLYEEILGTNERIRLIPHQQGSTCLSQVAYVKTSNIDVIPKLLQTLKGHGFEISRSYTPLHLQASFKKYVRTPLTNVDQIWPFLFELPCEPNVRLKDIRQLCSIVLEAMKKMPH